MIQNIFSQNKNDRSIIIKDYNKSKIISLKKEIEIKNILLKNKIELYVSTNKISGSFIDDEGNKWVIKNIINGKPIYQTTDNDDSAIATRTNFLQQDGGLGLNLDGENMHIATWDGGPTLATHQEFQNDEAVPSSRVNNPDLSASNDQSNHSTHVSGTIIAKGVDPNARGMAPKATLTSFDWDNDDLEALSEATNNGLLISNHSYGIPVVNDSGQQNAPTWMMGCYNTDARIWDNVAYNAPYYLMVASAGNDGSSTYNGGLANNYDKLTTNKVSKNNLVVANANNPFINPDGSGDLVSLFINTSSSQGPADDGRIKPDITADGTNVYSPISTNNSAYTVYSGTSMAAPNASGSMLLLQQYYNQLNNTYMRSATLKGLVCHTADDDNSLPGPDPIFGWGLLNSKRAAELIRDSKNGQQIIRELSLSQDETYTFEVDAQNTDKLSFTICWTDPAGNAQDNSLNSNIPALVNDLDIRVNNGSQDFFPWKLDLNDVTGPAIKGDNIVDNVEKIDIDTPQNGTYQVTISHKGTLTDGLQNYSLIVSGINSSTLSSNSYEIDGFKIYPNPTNNFININSDSVINKIIIYNILGKKITEIKDQEIKRVSLNKFSQGIYFIKAFDNNNNSQIIKVLKK